MYFDTHFHLNDPKYKKDNHDEIIQKAKAANLLGIINVSASYFEAKEVVSQALKYDFMYAAIGVHPSEVDKMKDGDIDKLEQLIIKNPNKIKAIGECGLDFYYDHYPDKATQIKWFIKQVKLAIKYNLTLIIHSRNAFNETINIIKELKPIFVIIHCFTYGCNEAKAFLDQGCYLSFSGIITFKKNVEDIKKALEITPLNRLLLETDAPLLTPTPYRGKINYPHLIVETYNVANIIKNQDVSSQVFKNVKKVFKI